MLSVVVLVCDYQASTVFDKGIWVSGVLVRKRVRVYGFLIYLCRGSGLSGSESLVGKFGVLRHLCKERYAYICLCTSTHTGVGIVERG